MNMTTADTFWEWLAAGGLLVLFPAVWCTGVWLQSRMGGWHRMAAKYSSGDRKVTGIRCRGVIGQVGSMPYGGVLTLHFNPDGFFLETAALYSIGHPRLFVPWSEITERRPCRRVWWEKVKLCVGSPLVETLVLPAELVAKHAPA